MLLEKASTDWLCTRPVFYNEKSGKISCDMNEVIDYDNLKFNAEGLRNYLKFGYTAFGQTMVEGVRCLDHSSQIVKNPDGSLTITQDEDVAEKLWNPGQTNGSDVFEEIINRTKEWADSLGSNRIILPLSGGFDSRLLAYSLKDRDDVYAYSYGLSANQKDSFEVVKAQQVAKACNLKWKQIDIIEFLKEKYLDEWYKLYGPSVHLHGMYQLEFYEKILRDLGINPATDTVGIENSQNKTQDGSNLLNTDIYMLSGIIGDGWAGTVRIPEINNVNDLAYLGYTHGMSMDEDICLLKGDNANAEAFWEKNKDKLKDENWRIIFAMRFKMMLLCYLLKSPQSMGIKTWSPFIDPKISMDMVNLDWPEKTDRIWQQREFEKLNLNIGWEKDKCDYNIVLNVENLLNNPVKPLDVKLLSQVIKPSYVEEVNRQLARHALRAIPAKPRTVGNFYNKAVKRYNDKIDKALVDYKILGSIERLLLRAEKFSSDR